MANKKKQLVSIFSLVSLLVLIAVVVSSFIFAIKLGRDQGIAESIVNTIPKKSQSEEVSDLILFVDRATALVASKGDEALVEFQNVNSQWVDGDNFIFAYELDGTTLVYPPQPFLVGTSRLAVHDVEGRYFVKAMIKEAIDNKADFFSYKYFRPGSAIEHTKLSYFKIVHLDNRDILVGSGILLD